MIILPMDWKLFAIKTPKMVARCHIECWQWTYRAYSNISEIMKKTESGDSSAVTRWTVDQEVMGSNPTHGGNLMSVVHSLPGFTQPIR